jgi:hypothetical protein
MDLVQVNMSAAHVDRLPKLARSPAGRVAGDARAGDAICRDPRDRRDHSAQLRGERVKIVVGFAFCSSR